MKLLLSIILIHLLYALSSQPLMSNYIVEYDYYSLKDYEISKDTISSILFFNEHYSLFEINKKEYDPYTLKFNENDEIEGDIVLFKDQIFKSYLDNVMLSNSDILFQKKSLLSQDMNDFEIIEVNPQDIKTILGYQCKSASILYKERKYKVYFTEEINSPFGPWKFHGLSGLILEVINEDELLYIKAKELKKVNTPFENPFSNKTSFTWDQTLTKASIAYSRMLEEMKKCCSQRSYIDFSNNLEKYILNDNFSIAVKYNVYIEYKNKNIDERSLDSTFELVTNTIESNYSYQEKIRNDQNLANYGYVSEKGFLYKNLLDSLLIQDKELQGEKYLIKDSIQKFDWQLTNEYDSILNHRVRKAEMNLKNQTIYAWYTSELPISNGPDIYSGLPGLILKVQIIYNRGNETSETRFYEAFETEQIMDPKIVIPNKGEVVSLEEFKVLQKESYKKMMEMYETGVDTSD